jgi:hypothetical protein
VCGLGNDAIELLHLRRAPDDAPKSLFRFDLLAQHPVLGFQLEMAHQPIEQYAQLLHAEGLSHVVVSPILHSLDRRLNCAVPSDNNHDRLGAPALDLIQRLKSACAG